MKIESKISEHEIIRRSRELIGEIIYTAIGMIRLFKDQTFEESSAIMRLTDALKLLDLATEREERLKKTAIADLEQRLKNIENLLGSKEAVEEDNEN